jgi:hypothetical protein
MISENRNSPYNAKELLDDNKLELATTLVIMYFSLIEYISIDFDLARISSCDFEEVKFPKTDLMMAVEGLRGKL